MVKRYRKQPVEIEAIEFNGNNHDEILDFVGEIMAKGFDFLSISIRTLEGIHTVSKGDYVIKGVKGEFYPCKPDIFHMTYEAV